MPAKKAAKRAARRSVRIENYRKRVALQPDGMPQGKHLTGFKGTKAEGICLCAKCNPAALKNKNKVVVINV